MKSLKMKSMAIAFATLVAGSANAGIITQWTVDVDSVFLPGSIVATDGSPGGVAISNSDRTLRWGTDIGNGQSGLDITNSPVSTVVTTGVGVVLPPVANVSVTHVNQPITAPSLDSVSLRSFLTLTPLVPALPGLPQVFLDFGIDFLETTNNPGTGVLCADGGTNGVGVNINGCADIFVIDQAALNFSFFYDSDGAGGDDPQEYFISFLELTGGLNPLPAAACTAVGVANPCLGFRTPEEANTTFQFGSIITTERVSIPEPGALALMGLGMGMMGLMLRRRRTATV